MKKIVSVARVEKRIKNMVTADDEMQKRVIINQQTLVKAERLVKLAGMPEDKLTPSIHHALVGMTAYMMVNTIDPKPPAEIKLFLQRYRAMFRRMRFEVQGEEDDQQV